MSEEQNVKEKQLNILGDFFGFLAIVITLIIPLLWEDMGKVPNYEERIVHVFYIEILIVFFVGICVFYFLRYQGKDKKAEILGLGLFSGIPMVLLIFTAPFIGIIIINWSNFENIVDFVYTLATTFITLILLLLGGVFYYYILKKLINFPTEKEEKTKNDL